MDDSLFRRLLSRPQSTLWRYTQSVLLVLLALMISFPLHFMIEAENLVMLFLAAVVLAATFLGRGPAILVSVLSVLAFDFFLVDPRLSFSVADAQYILTFLGLLAVGLVISNTVAQLRNQFELTRRRESHTAALNSLSQDLTGAVQLKDMLNSVVCHISQTFNRRVVLLLPTENGLRLAVDDAGAGGLDALEIQKAETAYHSQPGDGSHLTAQGQFQYLPLRTSLGPVGVLGLEGRVLNDHNERNLLQGFANLAALAIERARLAEQASRTQVLQNTERLQSALLSSISHELRTPLVSITGSLSTLLEAPPELQITQLEARTELLETAYGEAQRLNLLVGNLLDMSRLESGALRLSLEPCDLQDLVGIALERFGERRRNRKVHTRLAPDLPLLDLDMPLMVQVLVNLLGNAAKYTPQGSPIELTCSQQGQTIYIEVSDQGQGVPPEDLGRVFDKFYRSPQARNVAGLGLGLSISKGIVEAHGGKIQARNRNAGGLSIMIELPVQTGETNA